MLAAYLAPAQAAGVRVECDVRVPERLGLGATELSVLLSNLLSNAVEACERARAAGEDEPYLALSMRTSGNVLALRCENSAEPGASFLATSKENPREHGLGLPAMREIARRHRGELFAEAADAAPSCASASRSTAGTARQVAGAGPPRWVAAFLEVAPPTAGPFPPNPPPPPSAAKCGEIARALIASLGNRRRIWYNLPSKRARGG